MDDSFEINGTRFVWNRDKAKANLAKHHVSFESATAVFFDPFICIQDASQNNESRDAAIGFDDNQRLMYVVHIEVEGEFIRIISARKATQTERQKYDQ